MGRFAAIAALILAIPVISAAATPPEPASAPQSTQQEIAALRAELARIQAAGPKNTAQVAAARAKLRALGVRETALDARLGDDRNRLARLLSALQLFRRDPPPALLVRPNDALDAVRAVILIRAMTPELERRAAALTAQSKSLTALRREAAAANADLFAAESVQAEQRSDIERLVEGEEADQLYARSPGVMTTTLAPRPAGPAFASLAAPVPGPIVRPYGAPMPGGERAPGIAYRPPGGSAVHAPAAGTVAFAGPVTGWGIVVILSAGGSYNIVLAGLSEASVAPGQSVASGAPVGRMGNAGKSPSDLYMEVRRGGAPQDPTRWL